MHLLNLYFSPFAALMVVSALAFSQPDPATVRWALAVLAAAVLANFIVSRYAYRFIRWTRTLRLGLIGINYLWSVPLVYLLGGYWGPMWLLFLMAPATAALSLSRLGTWLAALASAATLLLIYWLRGLEGEFAWGQAAVHAVFIVFFSLFVHALAQVAVRLRDAA